MTKRTLLLTALLACTAGGAVLAAGHPARHDGEDRSAASASGEAPGRIVIASGDDRPGHRRHERAERHGRDERSAHERRHHDDDDDDDGRDRGGARRGDLSPTGPADPNAPLPQNGLFGGKSRPKVEVQ
ncbi:hypothetical protein [Prosthecomicrobium sp. N25]|uniref:hypothetical protein n=1 Tax=Prosthecomicrobium sp. N25 TaxID=3129254 RepID=UPI003077EDAB